MSEQYIYEIYRPSILHGGTEWRCINSDCGRYFYFEPSDPQGKPAPGPPPNFCPFCGGPREKEAQTPPD